MRMTSCLQAELSCDLRARRRMVGLRGESGWDYAYAVKAREPRGRVELRARGAAARLLNSGPEGREVDWSHCGGGRQISPPSICELVRNVLSFCHDGFSNCGITPSSRTLVTW